MTNERECIRGCTVRDVHFAACPSFGVVGATECRWCVPVMARDGVMVCDRCFHRLRRMIDDAPEIVGHLQSVADPTKAAVFDRVAIVGSKPEAPAPVQAELIDASADIVRTLRDWAEAVDGTRSGYRLEPGAAADVAHDKAREFADVILADFDHLANTVEVKALADAVLFRHSGDPEWWSIADAVAKWPLEDRARWALVPCPGCDMKQVRVIPPRRRGAGFRYVCKACEWEADDRSDDGLWGDVFAEPVPDAPVVHVRSVCGACVAGEHTACTEGDCACRCQEPKGTVWLTRAEAAARVGRDERTIRRWIDGPAGLRELAGRVRLGDVLEIDKTMRSRKGGRPKREAVSS